MNENYCQTSTFDDLRLAVRNEYIDRTLDRALRSELQELVVNAKDCLRGGGSRRRALFLVGESGSGKSFALRKHLAELVASASIVDHDGRHLSRVMSFEAPKPCTPKDMAVELLRQLGIPSRMTQTEGQLYSTVKTQLRENGILFIHVDEAQHLLNHRRPDVIVDVQDRVKSLMQIVDWPVHLILSGVNRLAQLRDTEEELKNRSRLLRVVPLVFETEMDTVAKIVRQVAGRCGLGVDAKVLTDDFLGRLHHAKGGLFGSIVEVVQDACFGVLRRGEHTLTKDVFAHNYQRDSGCMPNDNVFRALRWSEIDPVHATADLAREPKAGSRTGVPK